jgi:single-stranded-DNA-specific exonuclease
VTGAADPAWLLRLPAPLSAVAALTEELHVHPALASAIWSRGLGDGASRRLSPDLVPAPIARLDEAAERLRTAIDAGERILLHGDYDADGVSGTALLLLGLRALGGRVEAFLPDRLADGYGLSPQRVEQHAGRADLLVTIDCGISNHAEVAQLRASGVDVIVTDHHVPGATLPDALVVHPGLHGDDAHGTASLTGAGVAYHLLWALHRHLGLEAPLAFADLATIGTVADVAPLVGANRALVREGLARLADSVWPGVRALVTLNKLRGAVSAHHVAFVLAPRLNAAGRLGRAGDALELLTTASEDRARVLATVLDAHNGERRATQDRMLSEALELVDVAAPAIVLRHGAWHPGVMGIVASQVLERHYRPVYVVAQGKGSVRSTPGISAVEGLRAARQWLTRWGGHAAAAGFALDEAHFEPFRDAIYEFVASHDPPARRVTADLLLRPDQVTKDLFADLSRLEPYGQGFDTPLFAIHGPLSHARAVGNGGSHLQLTVGGVRGVSWGRGHEATRWAAGAAVTAVASLTESTYRDVTTIELRAQGLLEASRLRLESPREAAVEAGGAPAVPLVMDRPRAATRGRLHVGAPPGAAMATGARAAAASRHVTSLAPQPLDPLATLRDALALPGDTYLDLDDTALESLLAAAREYPDVHDVRLGYVQTQRGREWPWTGQKAELVRAALIELDLIDARGRARSGQRRDPYDAPTLRASLVARHALDTLVNALRALAPDDAARAITALVDVPATPSDAARLVTASPHGTPPSFGG